MISAPKDRDIGSVGGCSKFLDHLLNLFVSSGSNEDLGHARDWSREKGEERGEEREEREERGKRKE